VQGKEQLTSVPRPAESGTLFVLFVGIKTVYAVIRFIAGVLTVGSVAIVVFVLESLFQRERAKELAAEFRRAIKRE
jgi:hypothetical protein